MQFTDDVKLLRVTLDSTLSINKHVIDVTRLCHYHICALRHIRPLLTLDANKAMAVSIVGSRLDYCNSILYSMSQANIDRLQHSKCSSAGRCRGTVDYKLYKHSPRFTLVDS